VFHDDGFLGKYRRNDPAWFAATQGLDAVGWCGPMMVCCQSLPDAQHANQENTYEGVKVLDMDTCAFSHLASFLVDYSNGDPDHFFRKGPKVQGVELSCGQGAETHRIVRVPRTHPR
jgi:cobyric acid synthase